MEHRKYNPEKEVKGLSENHERAISITLNLIEKDIDEIERFINNAPKGRMYEIVDDLTEGQKEEALILIKSLKACINAFANRFGLKPAKTSIYGMLQSRLTTHWANACDIEPEKLRAYGTVDPDIVETLNFYTQKLIELLNGF